ncbi:DMT family transporter [Rhizobium halophytocola]|uniref:Drug/metabolite transporter (DMT)-like permease n=1 Tax=Rhizobium halophytocola TaxID=735519 RepID=A0ABS4DSF0_9HYPH|nr:DMT family transporter [Rhizobium halophytocola]MBP1848621.1 drug/metabolite transporter (DMT)-like permease [Rhizobium halophytocola]
MSIDRLAPALFVFLWSTGWIAAKFADQYADPLTFLALRYGTAAILFAAVALAAGVAFPKGGIDRVHALVSGMLLHGFYLGCVWWAIGQGVPAAISGIIAGLQPLMTAVAAHLMIDERLTAGQRAGLGLGFCGIAIAVLPNVLAGGAGSIPAFPAAVNVIGMVFVSVATVYQKKYLKTGDLRAVAALQYVGAFAVTLPAAWLLEPMHVSFGLGFFAVLAWSVVGISMGAVAVLLYLIRRGQVSRAASLIYLVPPLAALEALIAFGEPLTPAMIAGMVVTALGVWLVNRKGRAEPKETAPA